MHDGIGRVVSCELPAMLSDKLKPEYRCDSFRSKVDYCAATLVEHDRFVWRLIFSGAQSQEMSEYVERCVWIVDDGEGGRKRYPELAVLVAWGFGACCVEREKRLPSQPSAACPARSCAVPSLEALFLFCAAFALQAQLSDAIFPSEPTNARPLPKINR